MFLVGGRAWNYGSTYWSTLRDKVNSTSAVAEPEPEPAPQPGPARTKKGAGSRAIGSLRVESDPSGARVLIDGRLRGSTPVTLNDLAVGSHTLQIESPKGSVKRAIRIAADRPLTINQSIYSGWVHVSAPFELTASEGGRGLLMDEKNEILLPPGSHTLLFENRALGIRQERQVEVTPGGTTAISVAPSPSTLSVTSSLPADVLIDGVRVGETPLTDFPIPLGTHDIAVRSSDGAERRVTTTITAKPAVIDVDFSQP
jgi:hypothetical protein